MQSSMIFNVIIPRQNLEKQGHSGPHIWKRACAWSPRISTMQPNRADPEVHGLSGEAQEEHSSYCERRIHARRRQSDSSEAVESDSGMVPPGACSQVQLQILWREPDQTTFHRVVNWHNRQGSSWKKLNITIFMRTSSFCFLGIINNLPGHQLWKVGESVQLFCSIFVASLWVAR